MVSKKIFFDVVITIEDKRSGESLSKTLRINLEENSGISDFIKSFYKMNLFIFSFQYLNYLALRAIRNRLDIARQVSKVGVNETVVTKNGIVYNAGFMLLQHRIGNRTRSEPALRLIGAVLPAKNIKKAMENYKNSLGYLQHGKAVSILEGIFSLPEFDYIFIDADILFRLKEIDLMQKLEIKFEMLLSYPKIGQKEADYIMKNLDKKDNIFYYSDYFERDKESDLVVYQFLTYLIAEALLEEMPLPPFSWVDPLKWISEGSSDKEQKEKSKVNIRFVIPEDWSVEFKAGIVKLRGNEIAMTRGILNKNNVLAKNEYYYPLRYIAQKFIDIHNTDPKLLENRIVSVMNVNQKDNFYYDESKISISIYYDRVSMKAHYSGTRNDFISIKISSLYEISELEAIDKLLLIFFPEENKRKMIFAAILRVLLENVTYKVP